VTGALKGGDGVGHPLLGVNIAGGFLFQGAFTGHLCPDEVGQRFEALLPRGCRLGFARLLKWKIEVFKNRGVAAFKNLLLKPFGKFTLLFDVVEDGVAAVSRRLVRAMN
jgi:hypothetical protein